MKLKIKAGTTSQIARIYIQDSSSTTGAGLTGLAYNSASLTWYYIRIGETSATAVTLATATVGTFTSGGFKEVSATNMPGVYEIGIPNAAIASGATAVHMLLKGATNMAPVPIEIELDSIDYQDSVRAGLTALPNAAANASGGLLTFGSSSGQINPSSGAVPTSDGLKPTVAGRTLDVTTTGEAGIDWANIGSPTTSVNLSGTSVGTAAAVTAISSGGIASTSFAAGAINAAAIAADAIGASELASDAVAEIAGAVWDLSTTGHTTGGTFGAAMNAAGSAGDPWSTNLPGAYASGTAGYILGTNLNATVSSRMATFSIPTNFASLAITGGGAVTAGTVSDKTGYSLATTPPTSAVIAAAVWDLATTGHTTPGTFGAAMNAAGSAGDPWSTSLPGAYSSGTAGYIVGTNLNATVSSRMATFSVPTNFASLAITGGGAVTVGTNSDKTGYGLASTGLDSISTTAPTGVASNFREMLVQLWRRHFKKATATATEIKTYADNGSTVVTTQTVSDDGTTQTQGAAS